MLYNNLSIFKEYDYQASNYIFKGQALFSILKVPILVQRPVGIS